jgi:hypothetical protein
MTWAAVAGGVDVFGPAATVGDAWAEAVRLAKEMHPKSVSNLIERDIEPPGQLLKMTFNWIERWIHLWLRVI